ncbi:MAG: LuxR family transcriptional regulator [Rhizobiaceae bacterium]|nr:LuxR family transcriptional regulator [Rhizobiaceae bacterium]
MNSGANDQDTQRKHAFDAIVDAKDVEHALNLICELYPIGHCTYHLAQTMASQQNVDSPFVRTTYPSEGVARYLLKDYVKIDPILKEGMLRALPYAWSEIEPDEEAIELLIDFQSHGLGAGGYSIPIADKVGRRALFSLNALAGENSWDEIVDQYKEDWIELGQVLHKKAIKELYGDVDPAPTLSPRELETLHWTALGKDYKDIAIILDVSEHTIRTYMRTARLKLNCSSMTQAVAKASKLRLINP